MQPSIFDDLRVLIVGDQHAMRKTVAQLLFQSQIRNLSEAESARQALDFMDNPEEAAPDVIVCALHMTNMDGMEFVSKVRRAKNMVPIILVTGDNDTFLHDVAIQAGATKVLMIPISGPELVHEMEAALGFSLAS